MTDQEAQKEGNQRKWDAPPDQQRCRPYLKARQSRAERYKPSEVQTDDRAQNPRERALVQGAAVRKERRQRGERVPQVLQRKMQIQINDQQQYRRRAEKREDRNG